jgi:hypothetical protein
MIFWLLLSCQSADKVHPEHIRPAADTAMTDTGEIEQTEDLSLSPTRLLRRMSLDLRGVLPTDDEIAQVISDPSTLSVLRDAYLEDPRLEERLVHMLAERWHTRIDDFLVDITEYAHLAEEPDIEYAVERAIGEEPLRLIARIAMEDRPWSDVVQADHTMAEDHLASIWPLEHPGGGWAPATYTDGRPAAGVLSTNGLWWRYFSTRSNLNRARVAALTRLLICEDYAARTITFSDDETLASAGDLETALRTSPYCMGCHAAIDPIAATLMGFWPANPYQVDEIDTYHPERESLAESLLGVSPAWYGDPVYGLGELGAHIAADPRFETCAVQTMSGLMWRRETTLADFGVLAELTETFKAGGTTMRPLLSAITETEAYQASPASDANGRRLLTPALLNSAVLDLTGFEWTFAGYAQLDNDTIGYRNLAGGVDGVAITRPQDAPSLTWALTVQRLSEAAAAHGVQADLVDGDGPGLLDAVDLSTTSTDPAFKEQVINLHLRLFGEQPTPDWITAIGDLWEVVDASEGPQTAWTAVLSAMIRDPEFGSY